MKEYYPQRETLPIAWLVSPEFQPDFIWHADEQEWQVANVGRESIDKHCETGYESKPAVICLDTGETCTFGQIKEASDRLAGALIESGIKVGERLALRYASRPAAIIAATAAWKAGAVVVPIPAQARRSEIEFYLKDTDARWVIVLNEGDLYSELEAALPATGVKRVIIGKKSPGMAGESLEALIEQGNACLAETVHTEANDLAVIWHTGGTTGIPKATYHTHRRWLIAGRRLASTWKLDVHQRWVYGIPVSNVAGFLGRFICVLQHGATLIEPKSLSGTDVLEAIAEQRVTHLLGVPITLNLLADASAGKTHALSSLQEVYAPFLVTGAGNLYERWEKTGYRLKNPLGSSILCQWFIGPVAGETTPPFALGKPAAGYEARIVDIAGHSITPLQPGAVGRIAVRGPTGLTYWNRSELQKVEVREGWTITDDLGRKDDKNAIWFLGRLNNLIVTAGYKVAPGEVEQVLLTHPQVREAAVTGIADPLRGQVVAAFIVVKAGEGDEVLAHELQEWCKRHLAPYKYPRKVFFCNAFPRDPVGKVQLRTLVHSVARVE
ncbi:MAG: acyl--CoA ligase [Ktedonobacteraceae bacterium]|nr:acyl--CoA ligase [Ktedonobacteraceae bacterium]